MFFVCLFCFVFFCFQKSDSPDFSSAVINTNGNFNINEYVFGLVFNEYEFDDEIYNTFYIYFNGNEIIFNYDSLIPATTTTRAKTIYVNADASYSAGHENKCRIPTYHIPYLLPFLKHFKSIFETFISFTTLPHLPDLQYLSILTILTA